METVKRFGLCPGILAHKLPAKDVQKHRTEAAIRVWRNRRGGPILYDNQTQSLQTQYCLVGFPFTGKISGGRMGATMAGTEAGLS